MESSVCRGVASVALGTVGRANEGGYLALSRMFPSIPAAGVIKSDAPLANPDYAACFSMPRQ